jgi:hypothetical protein
MTSSGRLSPRRLRLTSTRSPAGMSIVDSSFTSRRPTRIDAPLPASSTMPAPCSGSRIVARTSKPRRASSIATARPIPRPAPVTRATPVGSMNPFPLFGQRLWPARATLASLARGAYERAFGTVRPLGPALHPKCRNALPMRGRPADRLNGPFAAVRGRGGPGDGQCFEERWEWERARPRPVDRAGLAAEHGGRATLVEQMIFTERPRAAARAAPASSARGCSGRRSCTSGRRTARACCRASCGTEIWCQGYPSRRGVRPREREDAVLDGDVGDHRPEGVDLARTWRSGSSCSRTNPDAPKHKGLSYCWCRCSNRASRSGRS